MPLGYQSKLILCQSPLGVKVSKRSKILQTFGLATAARRLVCGVCKGAIDRGEHYQVRRSPGCSYVVPLHPDCDRLLASSIKSRAR